MPESQSIKPSALTKSEETLPLPVENRVVVFGTRTDGVYELAKTLEDYIKSRGIDKPQVETYRIASSIREKILGLWDSETQTVNSKQPIPPRGVIALPYMRYDYGESWGDGSTPFNQIEDICHEYGIPFVKFETPPNLERLKSGLANILPPSSDQR